MAPKCALAIAATSSAIDPADIPFGSGICKYNSYSKSSISNAQSTCEFQILFISQFFLILAELLFSTCLFRFLNFRGGMEHLFPFFLFFDTVILDRSYFSHFIRKDAGAADRTCLESKCTSKRYRGFESHFFRQFSKFGFWTIVALRATIPPSVSACLTVSKT